MKPVTQEWIDKAEGDWDSALTLYRKRKRPNYDVACFLMQQCAEKYLKAKLEEANLPVPKIHNLPDLLTLVLPIESTWNALQSDLRKLNDYAIDVSYPGKSTVKADAKAAIAHCRAVRKAARQSFGLPV